MSEYDWLLEERRELAEEVAKLREELKQLRATAKAVVEYEWGDEAKGCKVGGGAAWKSLAHAVGLQAEEEHHG